MTTKQYGYLLASLFAGCVLLGGGGKVVAATYEVPTEYTTIQEAVDVALSGDTVNVLAGTYSGTGNKNIAITGKDISIIGVDGAGATEIDCENYGRGFYFDGSDGLLEGFTILNGSVLTSGHAGGERGGGIYIDNLSSPTIRNCVISNCRSKERGGGLYIHDFSDPVVESCTIEYCTVNNNGGGVACDLFSQPDFLDCLISGNLSYDEGGGAWSYANASPSFTRCVFRGNTADHGGALRLRGDAFASLTKCFLIENHANNKGAAINAITRSSVSVQSCTIADNVAGTYGGGFFLTASTANLDLTISWGNSAGSNGDEFQLDGLDAHANLSLSCTSTPGVAGSGYFHDTIDNVFEDPLFCRVLSDEDSPQFFYGLDVKSPCQPLNNPSPYLIGAANIRCDGVVGTEEMTWGGVKALYR